MHVPARHCHRHPAFYLLNPNNSLWGSACPFLTLIIRGQFENAICYEWSSFTALILWTLLYMYIHKFQS